MFCRVVDYARMRCRPSVSPEGKAVVIDMHMSIRAARSTEIIGFELVKTKKPGEPPGISRFSTLFSVAARGGK